MIQQILRHANVSTTMNIYVKTVSADECDEDSGNGVCNYRATEEARKLRGSCRTFFATSSASLDAGLN